MSGFCLRASKFGCQDAENTHRELISWPDLGNIEWIEAQKVSIRLLRLHHLYFGSPLNFFASLNSIPQVAFRVVRILSRHSNRLVRSELLLPMLSYKMIFDVDKLSILVHPLKGMAPVTVDVYPCIWCAMITEEHQPCVIGLGRQSQKIKECVVVPHEEVLWVSVLRADGIWSLDRVAYKEDRLVKLSTDSQII